jgi:hypothetical protein
MQWSRPIDIYIERCTAIGEHRAQRLDNFFIIAKEFKPITASIFWHRDAFYLNRIIILGGRLTSD